MTEEQIRDYKIASQTKTALLNKHSTVTGDLVIGSIFTPSILNNHNSLSYECYIVYTELQKEVDDAFKKAIERITNIISEI